MSFNFVSFYRAESGWSHFPRVGFFSLIVNYLRLHISLYNRNIARLRQRQRQYDMSMRRRLPRRRVAKHVWVSLFDETTTALHQILPYQVRSRHHSEDLIITAICLQHRLLQILPANILCNRKYMHYYCLRTSRVFIYTLGRSSFGGVSFIRPPSLFTNIQSPQDTTHYPHPWRSNTCTSRYRGVQ